MEIPRSLPYAFGEYVITKMRHGIFWGTYKGEAGAWRYDTLDKIHNKFMARMSKKENRRKISEKRKLANKKNSEFASIRKLAKLRDGFMCVECGATDMLDVHHIVHRADGGSNSLDNLQTLCKACHAKKHEGEPVARIMCKQLEFLAG